MEPSKEAEAGGVNVKAVVGLVVQIDEGRIRAHLDEVMRSTVEETLNALLDILAPAIETHSLRLSTPV